MKLAEVLVAGSRSSAPTAVLEPLPAAWASWDEAPARRRKSKMEALSLRMAVHSYKCLPLVLFVPGFLLDF